MVHAVFSSQSLRFQLVSMVRAGLSGWRCSFLLVSTSLSLIFGGFSDYPPNAEQDKCESRGGVILVATLSTEVYSSNERTIGRVGSVSACVPETCVDLQGDECALLRQSLWR